MYYGIPPEVDLGVVIEEENEEEEDKEKSKVSTGTFWKYRVVFNLVREVLQYRFSFVILCFSNKFILTGSESCPFYAS